MNLFSYVGNRIKELRTQYGKEGMSQESLAAELGVATNTISRWETATYHPNLEDLEKLARFFGKSILEFFPQQEAPKDERVSALLRAAKDLHPNDLDELQRYAEFRRARSLDGVEKKNIGRKRKNDV